MSALVDLLMRAKQMLAALAAQKSIRAYVVDYHVGLSELATEVFNGERTAARMASAHNALIREYARTIYLEGMSDGGINEPEKELDEDDEAAIAAFIADQTSYTADFADAAADTLDADDVTAAQKRVNERVKNWASRMEDFGKQGKLRAKDGVLAYWQLGKTEKHCKDCLANSRKRPMRAKKWRESVLPRSTELECHGDNCDCKLRSASTDKILY